MRYWCMAIPKLSRLEDHFPWVADIDIPVVYTGFVSEKLGDASRPDRAPESVCFG